MVDVAIEECGHTDASLRSKHLRRREVQFSVQNAAEEVSVQVLEQGLTV